MLGWIERIVNDFKERWGTITCLIVAESIIGLFIASFCLDKPISLSTMNEWISLIVGMVALILGIMSLFLSFYNVEQSNEVQRETINIMNDMQNSMKEELLKLKDDIKREMKEIPKKTADEVTFKRINSEYTYIENFKEDR